MPFLHSGDSSLPKCPLCSTTAYLRDARANALRKPRNNPSLMHEGPTTTQHTLRARNYTAAHQDYDDDEIAERKQKHHTQTPHALDYRTRL